MLAYSLLNAFFNYAQRKVYEKEPYFKSIPSSDIPLDPKQKEQFIEENCKILGIEYTTDFASIEKAFKKFAIKHHPDKRSGNSIKMRDGNGAYDNLKKAFGK